MTDVYEIEIRTADREVLAHGSEWRNVLTVELDEDGNCEISVDSKHSSDNGVPFSVWHRRTLRWTNASSQGASAVVDGKSLEALRDKIAPLIKIVAEGHSTKWDGNNFVGRLTEEAEEACDEIESIVSEWQWSDEDTQVWEASDWLYDNKKQSIKDLGLTADATAEQKAAAVKTIEEWAEGCNTVVVNADRWVDEVVEELREEREE